MNIFDWLNKASGSRVAPTPAEMLFATSILLLSELKKAQEYQVAHQQELSLAKRLEAIGFVNSYEVASAEQQNRNIALLTFMRQMWRDLGTNAFLVGFEQFRSILRKYDLMCVPFSHYKGDIPQKNVWEIERALVSVMERKEYARDYSILIDSRSTEELIDLLRFPWRYDKSVHPNYEYSFFEYKTTFDAPLFIAAPKECVEKPIVEHNKRSLRYSVLRGEESLMKQAEAILQGAKDYANVKYVAAPARLPYGYDPFVCSLCEYGVIVHSMWGPEAEDETIKRYEQLRDALLEKGVLQ